MYFEILVRIVLVFIDATGILLVAWVLQSGSKGVIKRWFALMTLFILLWANFSYFGSRSTNLANSLLLYRLNWVSVSLFFPSFYFFYVIYFLKKSGFAKALGLLVAGVSVLLAIGSLFSDLILDGVVARQWGTEILFGPYGIFFNAFSVVVSAVVVFYSLQAYVTSDNEMRAKLRFFLTGVFTFILANLIFNVGSQSLFNSVQYQIFGDFSSIFLLGFTAYATIQHRLFDVRVVAAEALTAFLMALLFAKIFASQSTTERIIDVFVFGLASIFGLLLVRSVNKEVEQKDELAHLNKRLKHMDLVKNEFISVAAHELRAPLTAIKGYLSMVLDGDAGPVTEQQKDFLQDALMSSERIIRLVNNLLNVSRIEEGRIVYQMKIESLKDIMEAAYKEFRFEAVRQNLDFQFQVQPGIRDRVNVDKDRLHEVIVNYISNAIKYTEQGRIVVSLKNPTPDTVRVEVIDSGPGISKTEQKKLFHKFYRIKSKTGSKTIGSGLGLYISKLLIKKFGGELGVTSQEGKGSNFWFELPVAPAQV